MGEFAKKLHRKLAGTKGNLPTKEPKRRPGQVLPGGVKDIKTLIKEGLDPVHAAYVLTNKGRWFDNQQERESCQSKTRNDGNGWLPWE